MGDGTDVAVMGVGIAMMTTALTCMPCSHVSPGPPG
jgi:hypothetical protein